MSLSRSTSSASSSWISLGTCVTPIRTSTSTPHSLAGWTVMLGGPPRLPTPADTETGSPEPPDEFASADRLRSEDDGVGAGRRRDVVVIALEPLTPQPEPSGEGVELLVAAIAHQMGPAPAPPRPQGVVNENHPGDRRARAGHGRFSDRMRRPPALHAIFACLAVLGGACSNGTVHHQPPTTSASNGSTTTPGTALGPSPIDSNNIYAADGPNMLSPAVQGVPYRIYLPDSAASDVPVIDPAAMQGISDYKTGLNVQHIVPAYDLQRLYATNDLANSLTPIDPMTGQPAGPNIPVDDPYNMYCTPDGKHAVVVAEARQHLDFRDPHTFALQKEIVVNCAGVDHIDFAADNSDLIATCEFSGKLVKVDLATETVAGYLAIGGAPQDIKLDPQGKIFYVADKPRGGVHLIDAATFTDTGFIPTGADAHALYPS